MRRFGHTPPASFICSWMQQRVKCLTVEDLVQANGIVKEMRDMRAEVIYWISKAQIVIFVVTNFSYAAFNIKKSM